MLYVVCTYIIYLFITSLPSKVFGDRNGDPSRGFEGEGGRQCQTLPGMLKRSRRLHPWLKVSAAVCFTSFNAFHIPALACPGQFQHYLSLKERVQWGARFQITVQRNDGPPSIHYRFLRINRLDWQQTDPSDRCFWIVACASRACVLPDLGSVGSCDSRRSVPCRPIKNGKGKGPWEQIQYIQWNTSTEAYWSSWINSPAPKY